MMSVFGKNGSSARHYRPDHSLDLSSRMSDWMRTVTSPTPYRVGTSFNINPYRIAQLSIIMLLFLTGLVLLIPVFFYRGGDDPLASLPLRYRNLPSYNSTYPLSPSRRLPDGTTVFKIGAVTDLDTDSKSGTEKNTWISYLKQGTLSISADHRVIKLDWEADETVLKSGLALKGRGMELSDLVVFNGKLYTCDDRTGTVFEISRQFQMLPFVVLNDGDGLQTKGFKCEWMTVKDSTLLVGGMGKEWTTPQGEPVNLHPQWVKTVGHVGDVSHHDWVDRYDKLRSKAGCDPPGYMIHESGMWSDHHQQWFFLPRRASPEIYHEETDERKATNILFRVDESFSHIAMSHVGKPHPTHGFSAFRFIPGTSDSVVVALKSEEDKGKIASYVTVFNLDGDILLEETKIGDKKYEGIEFI